MRRATCTTARVIDPSIDEIRAAQVRAASTTFLRLRPLVVLAATLGQAMLLAHAEVSPAQRAPLAALLLTAVLGFGVESWLLTRRRVSERWLWISLSCTLLGVGVAASASGGLGAPVATLLLAPLVVALSALHRRALPLAVLFAVVLAVLALAPPLGPALPADILAASHAVTLGATALLCTLAVVGLGGAHERATRSLEDLRQRGIAEAEAKGREAEALGARVAHELKNPLAAISALLELSAREASGREQTRFAVVRGELERMDRLVSDYLTLARPLTDVAPEAVAVQELLEGVGELLDARASRSAVRVVITAGDVNIHGDPRRLREALVNLAANAIDAMPDGGELTLAAHGVENAVHLSVSDTGPGIAPEDRARAGEAFFTRRPGGTGLGLLHARSVARLHGGELVLEHPERGLRAVLVLPEGGALAAPSPVG